jgi:hypothetical protein
MLSSQHPSTARRGPRIPEQRDAVFHLQVGTLVLGVTSEHSHIEQFASFGLEHVIDEHVDSILA